MTANHEHDELEQVFDTQQESEAQVVKGLLESFGIEALISGLDAPPDVLPGVGGIVLRVPPEQAEEARRIIAENRQPGGPLSDEMEETA